MRTLAVLPLLASAACTIEDKLPALPGEDPGPGTTTHSELNVSVSVVDGAGARLERDTFAAPEDVYFTVRIADAGKPVVAEDYVFQVLGGDGSMLSSDDFACRRFHVSVQGAIDGVHAAVLANGSACTHELVRTESRAIAIQAMPFAVGGELFVLRVGTAKACVSDDAFEAALAVPFAIGAPVEEEEQQPPPPPPEEDEEEPPPDEEQPPPDDEEPPPDEGDDDDDDGNNGNNGNGKGKGKGNGKDD